MIKKILFKDLESTKISSGAIFIFILITCFLFSTILIVGFNLSNSIETFLEKAKTPDYVQMHLGELDLKRLDDFAKENSLVEEYEVMKFLNIDSSDIYINGERFLDNFQDNGFSTQSNKFDFLLDIDGNVVQPKEGEVYTPLSYYLDGTIRVNDILQVGQENFKVMGPVRDSQMNPTLSSSKRFLINEEQYKNIFPLGREEYLIEFILKDDGSTSDFQGQYEGAGLEANGPTITKPLIKLVNGLSDGVVLAILFLIGLIILLLSFLSIRFTLLSKIEEDYDLIASLKCMGILNKDIKLMYLGKYIVLTFFAGLAGFILSLILSQILINNIERAIGPSYLGLRGFLISFIAIVILSLMILFYINTILSRIEKLSPVEAKRLGELGSSSVGTSCKLRKTRLGVNPYFAIKNLVSNKKLYMTFGLVLITAILVIILPHGIYNTISSDSFISYMGVGKADLIISSEKENPKLEEALKTDKDIDSYNKLVNKKYDVLLENGLNTKLWTKVGNHENIRYLRGQPPINEGQIALSSLALGELELDLGNEIKITSQDGERLFEIVGEYSDITNGGITGRLKEFENSEETLFVDYSLETDKPEEILNNYQSENISIIKVNEFRDGVLGSTISSLKFASILALGISILLIFLIGILFNNLIFNLDKRKNSIEVFLGYYISDIKNQYSMTNGLLILLSIIVSLIIAKVFGNLIINAMLSSFGIRELDINLSLAYSLIIVPIIVLLVIFVSVRFSFRKIDEIKDIDLLKG